MKRFKGVVVGLVLWGLVGCDPPGTTGLQPPELKQNERTRSINILAGAKARVGMAILPAGQEDWQRVGTPIPVHDFATGDVDGDGYTDLIIINNKGTFAIRSGKNDGWKIIKATNQETYAKMLVGDIDNNHKDDILIFSEKPMQIHSYSHPNFQPDSIATPETIEAYPGLIGDLDGDKQNDMLLFGGNSTLSRIVIHSSQQKKWLEPIDIPSLDIRPIAIGDVDGDGKNDIIGDGNDLSIRSSQTQLWKKTLLPEPFISSDAVAIGDADNDGNSDLVIADTTYESAPALTQVAIRSGWTQKWEKIQVPKIDDVSALLITDTNNDGKNEIIVGGAYYQHSKEKPRIAIYDYAHQKWHTTDVPGLLGISMLNTVSPATYKQPSSFEFPQIVVSSAQGIHVFGGKSLSVLHEFKPFSPQIELSTQDQYTHLAISDINQDGVEDIITANRHLSSVYQFDGKTQQLLNTFKFNLPLSYETSVASGDFNGDSFPDIVLGTYSGIADKGWEPQVTIFDGKTHTVISEFSAYSKSYGNPITVAVADINLDNQLDIITGTGFGRIPLIRIFDGKTKALLTEFFPYDIDIKNGISLATGDFNADGIPDIVTGTGPGTPAKVIVFDGKTQTRLAEFAPYGADFKGGVNVATGDYNTDGTMDIITGGFVADDATVFIFDGRNLSNQLASIHVPFYSLYLYGEKQISVAMLSPHPKASTAPSKP